MPSMHNVLVPASPSTYVPMQPITPTRIDHAGETTVIPQTPSNNARTGNELSRSLAGIKRKSSDQQGSLSRSTRRRGNSEYGDHHAPTSPTPAKRSGGNSLFMSLPASMSAPSQTAFFKHSQEEGPPLPGLSANGSKQQHLNGSLPASAPVLDFSLSSPAQYGHLSMSMPASAPAMDFSISSPAQFSNIGDSTSHTSSWLQGNSNNHLFVPSFSQPGGYHPISSSASVFDGPALDDGTLSAFGISYPASAPAATYFDINANPFEAVSVHPSDGVSAQGGFWPPPPTAFPVSAGPTFMGYNDGAHENGWNMIQQAQASPLFAMPGEDPTVTMMEGQVPLQAVPTFLPNFEMQRGSLQRDQQQQMPSTPVKRAGKHGDGDEKMALFASQVRRQAEKLTLADLDAIDEDGDDSDGSEYQDEGEAASPSKRRGRSGKVRERVQSKDVPVPVLQSENEGNNKGKGKADSERVKLDNRTSHSRFFHSSHPRSRSRE